MSRYKLEVYGLQERPDKHTGLEIFFLKLVNIFKYEIYKLWPIKYFKKLVSLRWDATLYLEKEASQMCIFLRINDFYNLLIYEYDSVHE